MGIREWQLPPPGKEACDPDSSAGFAGGGERRNLSEVRGGSISRREVIAGSVAVATLGASGLIDAGSAPRAFENPIAQPRVARILVDTRFAAARAIARDFARHLAQPGAELIALPRDVLELWHARLAPACTASPQAFAGVTTEHGFFLLRTLAADQRFHVQSATLHHAREEPLVSWVLAPRA